MEEFDLSTRDGFLRDYDLLEKAVFKAGNQIGADITDELLTGILKNCVSCSRMRKTAVESELGRITVNVLEDLAQSLQPKERLYRSGFLDLSCKLCTKLSYRDAAGMLNLFQHCDASQTVKLRTLSDCMEREGNRISEELEKTVGRVLKMYGLDAQTGLPAEGVCLSQNITQAVIPKKTETQIQAVSSVIDATNTFREEKIPFTAAELDIESSLERVYASIDDVGVKHQKDSRDPDAEKGAKYIENTVIHIQNG